MGWLEGVLTGYAKRHYEIEDQKREEAGKAADREAKILDAMLQSKYPEIKNLAAAGMLDLGNPRRRARGIAGWLGEMEKSPYLPAIERARAHLAGDRSYAREQLGLGPEDDLPDAVPATPSIPTTSGSVQAQPSAALPSESLTTGGQATAPTPPPPTPPPNVSFKPGAGAGDGFAPNVRFGPGAGSGPGISHPSVDFPPPAPPSPADAPGGVMARVDANNDLVYRGPFPPPPPQPIPPYRGGPATLQPLTQGGAQGGAQAGPQAGAQAGPPTPPAGPPLPVSTGPPVPPGQVGAGLPNATTGSVGRMTPPRSQRTQLPGIFPTQAELQADLSREQARSVVTGKIEGYAEMYRRQGFSEQESQKKAADLFERDLISTTGQPYKVLPGDLVGPDGNPTPAYAMFNAATSEYTLLDGRPLPPGYTFRPRQMASMTNAGGVWYQMAARDLFPGGVVPFGQEDQVVAHAQELASSFAGATTTARGEAGIQVKLKTPIGVTAGRALNLPPTTTLEELDTVVPLDQDQKNRVFQMSQIELSIKSIDDLIPKVFPNVEAGTLLGRLQSAYALGKGWLTASPDLAQLDAAIQASLGQIVKLGGDTGQLSASDMARAQAVLSSLTPSLFAGDTLATAKARLDVIKALLAKAKAPPPGYRGGVTPNEPAVVNKTPEGTVIPPTGYHIIDGRRYLDGKEIGQ